MASLPSLSPYTNWRRELWLFLSSFGVCFALLSWAQEAQLLNDSFLCPVLDDAIEHTCRPVPSMKGWFAVLLGLPLYLIVAREHDGSAAAVSDSDFSLNRPFIGHEGS